LTPSARSANLIAGDGTRNGLSAPNKEPEQTKNHLTEKLPYKSGANSSQPKFDADGANLAMAGPVFVSLTVAVLI